MAQRCPVLGRMNNVKRPISAWPNDNRMAVLFTVMFEVWSDG